MALLPKGTLKNHGVQGITRHGYAVASIGYRLTTVAPFPALLHDCKGAVRFLRANADKYHINGGKMGASGASAGGHLAGLRSWKGTWAEISTNQAVSKRGWDSSVLLIYSMMRLKTKHGLITLVAPSTSYWDASLPKTLIKPKWPVLRGV